MKKILFLLCFVLVGLLRLSAQPEITISKPYKVVDADDKIYVGFGEEMMSLKIEKKLITIQKFDANLMKEVSVNEYEDFPSGTVFERLVKIDEKHLYFFFSLWDKENKMEQLCYRTIDFSEGKFLDKPTVLFKVDGKVTGDSHIVDYGWFSAPMGTNFNKFRVEYSYDRSKILVHYRVKPEIKNDKLSYDYIGLIVLDPDLNFVSKAEVKMPYTEKNMDNIDYSVDNEGNAYILASVRNDLSGKLKPKKDEPQSHIELLRIPTGSTEVTKLEVELDVPKGKKSAFIKSILLFESPQNCMIMAGFFGNEKKDPDANGIFITKAAKEGEVYDTRFYEFPSALVTQNAGERAKKRNEKKDDDEQSDFKYLVLDYMKVLQDGSVVFTGEQYRVEVVTHYGANGTVSTTYIYHYDNIFTAKINPDNELAWMRVLPKRQVGTAGKGGMSYSFWHGKDCSYFYFLDNVDNMDLKLTEIPKRHKDGAGGFFTAYVVNDETGEVKKQSLFDLRDTEGLELAQFATNRVVQISDDTFLIEFYKKKKQDVFIRMVMNE